MLAKEKLNVYFIFSHDKGNICLLFLGNSSQGSSSLDLEMLASGRQGERHIIKLCK